MSPASAGPGPVGAELGRRLRERDLGAAAATLNLLESRTDAARAEAALLLAEVSPAAFGGAEAPGHVDTIANVAAAGRASVALIEPAQLAMNDALSVMRRLASDTTVQKALLAYSQKQDVASATGYLQRLAPNSVVTA